MCAAGSGWHSPQISHEQGQGILAKNLVRPTIVITGGIWIMGLAIEVVFGNCLAAGLVTLAAYVASSEKPFSAWKDQNQP
jgi:hypothetical protein